MNLLPLFPKTQASYELKQKQDQWHPSQVISNKKVDE